MLYKKRITAIALVALMSIPTIAQANDSENFKNTKKSFGITNKKSLNEQNQPDVTSGHYNDGTSNVNMGLRGGELELINTTNPTLEIVSDDKSGLVYTVNQNGFIAILDNRYSGEGWALYLKASPLTELPKEGGLEPKGGWKVGKEGHITYEGVTEIENQVTASGEEVNIQTAPTGVNYSKPIPIDYNKIKVAYATKNSGMGMWKIDDAMGNIKITLDDSIEQDKENYPNSATPYVTTFEWTLVSGPGIR